MRSCSLDSRSWWMTSASAARPEVIWSNTLLRACVGRKAVYLESSYSSEIGAGPGAHCGSEERDGETREMGAHLRRNWRESKWALRVMASGFSAPASSLGFRARLTTPLVR